MKRFLPALLSSETTPEPWLRRVLAAELEQLRARHGASASLLPLGPGPLLPQVEERASAREPEVAAFFRRVSWLVAPPDRDAVAGLDPERDCDRLFHFVARDFRSELKIFAVLHEMRAAVSLPLASFFLDTGEFSERGTKRIVDTVLLVCNVLEWGKDSARGRYCLDRINHIHAHYRIPNAAFKFVLCGILFVPWEWNQRFGWRELSATERLGWYHAFIALGRAMNIAELDEGFDATYAWYRDVSDAAARYAPNKQRLVRDILGQVLARYPAPVRALVATALLAGMDETYLSAAALPRVPAPVEEALRRLFRLAGESAAQGPNAVKPWIQSLLTSSVYPEGYELSELGVGRRSARLPDAATSARRMSPRELAERVKRGELLVVLEGGVYDLGGFAEHHPGGRAILERHAGTDASAAFASAPHSAATRWFRENYRIAVLDSTGIEGEEPRGSEGELPSRAVLGLGKSRRLPTPVPAETLAELVPDLLALVNHRASDPLDARAVLAQLELLCAD